MDMLPCRRRSFADSYLNGGKTSLLSRLGRQLSPVCRQQTREALSPPNRCSSGHGGSTHPEAALAAVPAPGHGEASGEQDHAGWMQTALPSAPVPWPGHGWVTCIFTMIMELRLAQSCIRRCHRGRRGKLGASPDLHEASRKADHPKRYVMISRSCYGCSFILFELRTKRSTKPAVTFMRASYSGSVLASAAEDAVLARSELTLLRTPLNEPSPVRH